MTSRYISHLNPLADFPLTIIYGCPRWPSWSEWDVPGTAKEPLTMKQSPSLNNVFKYYEPNAVFDLPAMLFYGRVWMCSRCEWIPPGQPLYLILNQD